MFSWTKVFRLEKRVRILWKAGFALIMIFTINTKLALCMLCILPFTVVLTVCQFKRVKPAFHNIRTRFSSPVSYTHLKSLLLPV